MNFELIMRHYFKTGAGVVSSLEHAISWQIVLLNRVNVQAASPARKRIPARLSDQQKPWSLHIERGSESSTLKSRVTSSLDTENFIQSKAGQ